MKNIKKLSLILALFFIFSSSFCITSFAEEKETFIIDTNTVYAEISDDYSFFPYDDRFYFINEEVGTFWVFQAENFNLEKGVKNTKLIDETFYQKTYIQNQIYNKTCNSISKHRKTTIGNNQSNNEHQSQQ